VGVLRRYAVTVNGNKAVLQLSDEDAKSYGDAAIPVGPPPVGGTEYPDDTKVRVVVRNKVRTVEDK